MPLKIKDDARCCPGAASQCPTSNPVQLLYDYWLDKCRPNRIPSRADIHPEEIVALLPYVTLLDVVRQQRVYRFKVHLIGTHMIDVFGFNPTGQYVDEYLSSEHYARVYTYLSSVVSSRLPVYGTMPVYEDGEDLLEFEAMTMPLSASGEKVDMLLGGRRGLYRPVTSYELAQRSLKIAKE